MSLEPFSQNPSSFYLTSSALAESARSKKKDCVQMPEFPRFSSSTEKPAHKIQAQVMETGSEYEKIAQNILPRHSGPIAWNALDIALANLPSREIKINELCEALEGQSWNHPIFEDIQHFPYYGLAALKDGKLTRNQFATLMQFWSVCKHHDRNDILVVKLFDSQGFVNPEARELIRKTIKEKGSSDYLNETQLDDFFTKMKSSPKSEQQLFVVPDIEEKLADSNFIYDLAENKRTITQDINKLGINIFCRFEDQAKRKRMVASLEMMQTFLNVAYPENCVKISPVIGLSTLKDIENNGVTSTRDFALPFPGLEDYPDEADYSLASKEYDFMYHDFYHSIIASNIPKNDQKALILIAQEILEMKAEPENKEIEPFLRFLYEKIIDMEHSSYKAKYSHENDPEITKKFRLFTAMDLCTSAVKGRIQMAVFRNTRKANPNTPKPAFEMYSKVVKAVNASIDQVFDKYEILNKISDRLLAKEKEFKKLGFDFSDFSDLLSEASKNTQKSIKTKLSKKETSPEKAQIMSKQSFVSQFYSRLLFNNLTKPAA